MVSPVSMGMLLAPDVHGRGVARRTTRSGEPMRKTLGSRRVLSGLAAWFTLLVTLPVVASDEYPATSYFLDGVSEQSSWSEILAKPGMKAEFPFIAFETTFVPLESVCVDGSMLAIANPKL